MSNSTERAFITFCCYSAEFRAGQLKESGTKIGIVGDFVKPHVVDCVTRHLSLQIVHAFEEKLVNRSLLAR